MKKLLVVCSAVFLLLLMRGVPVFADNMALGTFTASVSTYPITEVATMATQVAKNVNIHKVVISNSNPEIQQLVSFYSQSDSTTTVTLEYAVEIASTSEYGVPFQMDFNIAASHWTVHDLCIRKSSVSSEVRVTVFYH